MADLWVWVTMGDDNVCPDCVERGGWEPKTWDEWVEIGLPRTGSTLCMTTCRCDPMPAEVIDQVPDELVDISDEIESLIDELMHGVKFDKMNGEAILLKHFKDATGLKSLSLSDAALFDSMFEQLTALIVRFNSLGRILPKEYYQISNIRGKIAWLERELGIG